MSRDNARKLYAAMAHHAKQLEPLISALALGYAIELEPLGWKLRPWRSGPNSFALTKGNKQYHLRAGFKPGVAGYSRIDVKDAYFHGKVVAKLDSRLDVLRFVEKLKKV